jgi:N-ethylmaleimide reductase
VAPSALRAEGEGFSAGGKQVPYSEPHALTTDEVREVVGQYRQGAANAKAAGFDGVEIHAANGYLIDQFLRTGANERTDRYGGSLEGRARFLMEVVEAVTGVWGAERVGVRFSPLGAFNDMHDEHPAETFEFAARSITETHPDLAYLHLVEPEGDKPPTVETSQNGSATGEGRDIGGGQDEDAQERREVFSRIREAFEGPLVANGGYDRESAERALEMDYAQAVSFGRAFLANPDLPERFAQDAPLNEPNPDTFYGGGAEGYVDYPTLEEREDAGVAA